MPKPPPTRIDNKPPNQWPCYCCTCHSIPGHDFDPKCHVHSDHHGRRGCVKHNISPIHCNDGCVTDPALEAARHTEMQARGHRYQQQVEQAKHPITIRTDTTPEELAAYHQAKREAAIEQHEARQQHLHTLVQVAVQRALAEQGTRPRDPDEA